MSSTRFNPPVPDLQQVNSDGSTRPDEDGTVVFGENDYGSSNKRTLRSYISSLSRGSVPTQDITEYNGPIPDHGNAYALGDGSGTGDETFTKTGIEGGAENQLASYSNSGMFDGRGGVDLGGIVKKGSPSHANGSVRTETLSGHLLLAGVGHRYEDSHGHSVRSSQASSQGAEAYTEAIADVLGSDNYYDSQGRFSITDGRLATVKEGEDTLRTRSVQQRVTVDTLKNVAVDILLASSGKKPKGPVLPTIAGVGVDPSVVQQGYGRVLTADMQASAALGVSGFNAVTSGDAEELPTDDGVGETRYTDKSYGSVYNPLEPFTSFTSSVTSFALLAAAAFGTTLAVGGVISLFSRPSDRIPTNRNFTGASKSPGLSKAGGDESYLEPGKFKFNKEQSVFGEFLNSIGISTNVADVLNLYIPTNSFADYGKCVVVGFASLIGVSYEDDDIITTNFLTGEKTFNALALLKLAGLVAARFLTMPLTSERGYYMNLFREIIKESSSLVTNFDPANLASADGLANFTGSKIVRFIDTLARVGDLVVLQSSAKSYYKFNEKQVTDPYEKGFNPGKEANELVDPLKSMKAFAAQRIRGSQFGSRRGSSLGVSDLPSAHLVPVGYQTLVDNNKLTSFTISNSVGKTNLRLDQSEVQTLENALDSEYMPFYFQDLRTNEIVAFHAFLEDLSDSYTANYNSVSGYGRIEDIKTYKDTKRSVGCTFHVIATNPGDFDYMWWQINKLTTMVYPQWSQGRDLTAKLDNQDNFKFTQPFSQIPTATPVIRFRVGDLIRSNYSKFNLKRLFGYKDANKNQETGSGLRTQYYLPPGSYWDSVSQKMVEVKKEIIIGEKLPETSIEFFGSVLGARLGRKAVSIDPPAQILYRTAHQRTIGSNDGDNSTSFYKSENNSIIKSFESTMGQGLATVVTQLSFTWMDGLWGAGDDGPGNRAPRSCKVQMSFEPIHDIAPGLDHEGFNRAPIYPVGQLINNIVKGDNDVS